MALLVATTMASSVAGTAVPAVHHSLSNPIMATSTVSIAAPRLARKSAVLGAVASSATDVDGKDWVWSGAVALGAAAMVLLSNGASNLALADETVPEFQTYYGTAASASSYGGYGGNANKKDSAEYIFDVPQGWKERQISKVEKGTNGTDAEFYNPRRKEEKVYLTYLSGFRKLGPRDNVLNNLALSDVNLQDILGSAEDVKAEDLTQDGRLYYVFEIDSPVAHELIKVTCAKNKLYTQFVKAPASDWARDNAMLRKVHDSFTTIGDPTPLS
ncbi:hypothetical protein M758_4G269100 [Ceratodon purpureus]|nr:hypothetical protein M758_4G269100 [Ceratodon purpureus]